MTHSCAIEIIRELCQRRLLAFPQPGTEIRSTASVKCEIAIQIPVRVGSRLSVDAGAPGIVCAKQIQRYGGGVDLHVRRRRKELIGIARVDYVPVLSRDGYDPPARICEATV